MKLTLNVLFSVSAISLALAGLVNLFAPEALNPGVVSAGASPLLLIYLREPGVFQIVIAILNWMARNAEASKARDAIVLANTLLFGLAGIKVGLVVLNGGPIYFLIAVVINLLFAAAFFWVGRTSMSTKTS